MDILTLNTLVALAALVMMAVTASLVFVQVWGMTSAASSVASHALLGAALVAVSATVMSLVYSEYFGVVPCGLCWLARTFMFSLAVVLPLAWWRGERSIAPYGIALAVVGAAVSLYHHYIQMGGTSVLPCPASGAGDCAKRIIFEFGFVTFPLVGFACFTLILALLVTVHRAAR